MSAIHRVDDIRLMDGPRFFRLAHRLPWYEGVMRGRVRAEMAEQEEEAPRPQARPQQQRTASRTRPGYREVPATKAALSLDPAMQGIFSFGSA
jgi:hypothetical protein